MDKMKNDFQRLVRVWRENYNMVKEQQDGEKFRACQNPKANMNGAQQLKNTATINCNHVDKKFIDAMMNSPLMDEFLTKYNAKASLEYKVESEYTKFWQIRINY